ncbi:MAG TPA: HEPN domain-containing protein [Chryseolinea sp.]|nr:HEPN domain-containing protein [Chryseolinea sp.]
MEEYNRVLLRNCLTKSLEAFNDAKFNFENNRFKVTLNRIYYSIFYSVMALGYKENFITSKHKRLMGWFNKIYIHENNIFDERLMKIYQKSFNDRQEADYTVSDTSNLSRDEIELALNDAELFNNEIKKYLDKFI